MTAASDKVIPVEEDGDFWLLNLEFQADHELGRPHKLHYESVVLHQRHGVLVRSAIILLRRQAFAPDRSGELISQFPHDPLPYDVFRYQVLKLWLMAHKPMLAGDVGLLPLAPLTDSAATKLPEVLSRIDERLRAEVSSKEATKLWTATFFLMGLRYKPADGERLIEGVIGMTLESSSTYQWLMNKGRSEGHAEGRLQEARSIIVRLGSAKFGTPDADVGARLDRIIDIEQLELMTVRLLHAVNWHDLLDA